MAAADLTTRVAAWRDRGGEEEFRGRRIHLFRRDGGKPLLLFLHGFPSSSYDWKALLERETEHGALAPDFLGFGLSEKPRDHIYTLALAGGPGRGACPPRCSGQGDLLRRP